MSQLLSLFTADLQRIRNWFSSHRGAKLLVVVGFLLVVAIVVIVEFILANTFFMLVASQGEFGKAVADYGLNAALLVIFIFAFTSSLAANGKSLFKSKFLNFLLSSPLAPQKLFISRLFSPLLGSTLLLYVFFLPVIMAYGKNYSLNLDFILRSILSLLLLSISAYLLGAAGDVVLVKKFGNLSRKTLGLIFLIAIIGTFFLIKFLFPPAFFRLYYAVDWQEFSANLGKLPLLSLHLPTNWLSKTITDNWSIFTVYALLTTTGISIFAYLIGKSWYLQALNRSQESHFAAGKETKIRKSFSFPFPLRSKTGILAANELLNLFRSPGELTYLVFLSTLTVFLLFLMRNIPALHNQEPEFTPAVYALSLAGLSYLFMTFYSRVVYPLMAKEKRTSWFIFSLPMTRESLIFSKTIFSLITTLPSLVIAVIAVNLAGLPWDKALEFVILLTYTTVIVSLTQLFFGIISPNFSESENLDATSTSGSGLAAIVVSLFQIIISALSFYFIALELGNPILIIAVNIVGGLLLIFPLQLFARRSVHGYNL